MRGETDADNGQQQAPDLPALAKALTRRLSGQVIFGEPVRHETATVVPVAKASWGIGGGGGFAGRGAGGGLSIKPVGYIVIDKDGARYRPISSSPWTTLLAAGAVAAAALAFIMPRRAK